MVLTGTLEELSSQRRSKKIGDGAERKETELNVLCCRDSGRKEQKIEKAQGEGSCQACCTNC